jgi:hypothetical protein
VSIVKLINTAHEDDANPTNHHLKFVRNGVLTLFIQPYRRCRFHIQPFVVGPSMFRKHQLRVEQHHYTYRIYHERLKREAVEESISTV